MFMLTVSFAVARHRKSVRWRNFSQPAIPILYSWLHLQELILNACLHLNRVQDLYQPTFFRIIGKEMSLADYRRNKQWKDADKLLSMFVVLDPEPANPTIHVVESEFLGPSVQGVRADMEFLYGKPLMSGRELVVQQVPSWIRNREPIDPQKYRRAPEPSPDGLPLPESSGLPRLESNPYPSLFPEDEELRLETLRGIRGRRIKQEIY